MPGFDRTGPQGRGMRTGRGMGVCPPVSGEETVRQDQQTGTSEGSVAPAQYGAPMGVGFGRGVGRGMGPGVVYGVGRGGIPRGCGRGFCGGRMRRGLF